MAEKKKDEAIEVKEAEKKKDEVVEPKTTTPKKDIKQIHIQNRLVAINKIQDRAKAKRAAARLFRKGN